MGSDSAKSHEAFTIAPGSGVALATTALPQPPPTAAHEHAQVVIAEAFAIPVLPPPEAGSVGDPAGIAMLVGGADLEDSSATLICYAGPDAPREVLHATVTRDAEPKLLEAIQLSDRDLIVPTGENLLAVTVDKAVYGRLPLDEQHQLFDRVQTLAKSVNHHLKAGDGIPEHTKSGHAKLVAALDDLESDPVRTPAEKAMLAHYRDAVDQLAERLADGYAIHYADGGKLPILTAYEVSSTVQVTELVPAPQGELPDGLVSAHVRQATRIKPTLQDGKTSWDGHRPARPRPTVTGGRRARPARRPAIGVPEPIRRGTSAGRA